jgi:hypothetical protein
MVKGGITMQDTDYIGILSSSKPSSKQKERALNKAIHNFGLPKKTINISVQVAPNTIFTNKRVPSDDEIRIDLEVSKYVFYEYNYENSICDLYLYGNPHILINSGTYRQMKQFVREMRKTISKSILFAKYFIRSNPKRPLTTPEWFPYLDLKWFEVRQDYVIKFSDDFKTFELMFENLHLWRIGYCVNIKPDGTISTNSMSPIYAAYAKQNQLVFCERQYVSCNNQFGFYRIGGNSYPNYIPDYIRAEIFNPATGEERGLRTKEISDSGLYYIDHVTDKSIWLVPTSPVIIEHIEIVE